MAGLKRDTRRSITSSLLHWSPPTLSDPRIVVVSNDPASRYIELNSGEDLLLIFNEPAKFDFNGPMGVSADGIVTVVGGRNVNVFGAHFIGEPGPITSISVQVEENDMVINVPTTEGFPPNGHIRVDGEFITYSSKTPTSFIVEARRNGYYLDSPVSSSTIHLVGAKVYLGEYSRTALSMRTQTGTVHIEGFLAEGFLNDGLRIRGTATTIVQFQNFWVGPVVNHEKVNWTDGHPDCVQTWGNGAAEVRLGNGTLIAGRGGKCIENAADTTTGTAVGKIVTRNLEMIDDGTNFLCYARSAPTTWDVANTWIITDLPKDTAIRKAGDLPDPVLAPMIGVEKANMRDRYFIKKSDIGIGYVSPGYIN